METFNVTGEIREELNIEWIIADFFKEGVKLYVSHSFSFAGHVWCLRMYPNGRESKKSDNYISLYLRRNSFGPAIRIKYSLGLKTLDGETDPELHCVDVFDKAESYGLLKFLRRSELLERKSNLLVSNALIVVCSLKRQKSTENETNEKFLNDMKNMMMNGDHSDVIIKVSGEEFKLHKNILGARNPFFESMFRTEMREKVTGIVCIDDCEPHIFRSFIHFLYTGKVDKLLSENVCDLYQIADKYQENQLKEECLHFMMNTISVDNFYDFTVLAIHQDEKKMLQAASEFFCINAKKIMRNLKWQTFQTEYPTQANEMHNKALNYFD